MSKETKVRKPVETKEYKKIFKLFKYGEDHAGWFWAAVGLLLLACLGALLNLCQVTQGFAGVVSFLVMVLADGFMLWLLLVLSYNRSDAAHHTVSGEEKRYRFSLPYKPVAMVILLLLFITIVVTFAVWYLSADALGYASATDTLSYSLASMLGHDTPDIRLTTEGKWIYFAQVFSTLLYVFMALPVMVALMSAEN